MLSLNPDGDHAPCACRTSSLASGNCGVPCFSAGGAWGLLGSGRRPVCAACWAGLRGLPEGRCPRCALCHGEGDCPEATAWDLGDALLGYHGGRPPLGALLVPAIKRGEAGWRRTLLQRVALAPLPPWAAEVDLVTWAPGTFLPRLLRGFDQGPRRRRCLLSSWGGPVGLS